jgi:hypothetical protein
MRSHKSCSVCHSGLDPESSVFLDSRFRGNDDLYHGMLPSIGGRLEGLDCRIC